MKYFALVAFSIFCFASNAQLLKLKSGSFTPPKNIESINDFATWEQYQYDGRTFCMLQFGRTTSSAERAAISKETNIQFYDYFPELSFLVAIPANFSISTLSKYGIQSILPYKTEYKIAPKLLQRPLPTWMDKGNNRLEILVEIMPSIAQQIATTLFTQNNFPLIKWKNKRNAIIEINENDIAFIAALPWVKYLQTTAAPAVVENLTERTNHRVNSIDEAYVTGLSFDGTGVSIAIGDDGLIGPHIDFRGRLTDHTSSNTGTHADHVAGIAGGGGNMDPITSGSARGADIHIYQSYDNLTDAPLHYLTQGVRVTTNSLGQGCNVGYNADARDADELINIRPALSSVHSAGNSGNTTCGGAPNGFYTITGGYKSGKNVLAVGNVNNSDGIASSSSKGPAEDGRIKPEIVAVGTDVYSTQPDNTYDTFTGTSMSCPAVAGALADLVQAYRETHAGADPYNGLLKALLMNTADDLGNAGPDFTYGFGRINTRRAFKAMIGNQYFIDSMSNGDIKDFFINAPANTRQVKVMLYWNDVEGNPASAVALVNNLNMSVQEPSGNVLDPWVLDPTPTVAALTALPMRKVDNLNNVEQVTLDSLFSGTCIITVSGTNIPFGPQKYIVAYEFINDDVTLTYPNGGESFAHGRPERIRWDAYGNAGTFDIDYSSDGGSTWNPLTTAIPGDVRFYDWTPPSTFNTGRMSLRIKRGAFSDQCDTLFTIFEVPKNLVVDTACGTQFKLSWDVVPLATEYTIYSLGPKYMEPIATSTTNGIILTGVNTTDTFYYAVSANIPANGAKGLRTLTYIKLPGNVNCVHNAYNVETILPFKEAYSCSFANTVPIKVKIKNIGFKALTNLPIFYQVNANPVVSATVPGPINIGDSLIYTFPTLANFAAPIAYTVRTWTSLWTDIIISNDSSENSASVLTATTLAVPTSQDFEGPAFPPPGWRVLDADTSVKWQKTLCLVDPTGFNSHAAYMDFYNYDSLYQQDDLETLQFDLTGVTTDSVHISFDLSHAFGVKGIDSLRILVSEDCGNSYVPTTYYKAGSALGTTGPLGTIFSPTLTTQWRNERLSLTSYIGKKIFVRFRGSNMQGNNLFIDNINMLLSDVWVLGMSDFDDSRDLMVYPNPSNGNHIVELNSSEAKQVRYSIYNIAGQKVKENRFVIGRGITKAALNISDLASGLYMLELTDGKSIKKVKLSKY